MHWRVGYEGWPSRCARSGEGPACTGLLSDPVGVLGDKERWPDHFCFHHCLLRSLVNWTDRQQSYAAANGETAFFFWRGSFPLPIGRRALKLWRQRLVHKHEAVPPEDFAVALPSNYSEYGIKTQDLYELPPDDQLAKLSCLMPFDGGEEAVLALQVQGGGYVLDLFGLAGRREEGLVYPGDLAFNLRGRETFPKEVLDNARRWWNTMTDKPLPIGRPRGSGTWRSREELSAALDRAVRQLRAEEIRPTQEKVAALLHCNDRLLRHWLSHHGIRWEQVTRD
jgi:hypothetical protein